MERGTVTFEFPKVEGGWDDPATAVFDMALAGNESFFAIDENDVNPEARTFRVQFIEGDVEVQVKLLPKGGD